ncbi:MAG: AAA family ATPase [Chloroflexota bacterium]|nr:AAA family ATPase [Chloroflexota bacterium]
MYLAFAGKGSSGKSTIAAMLIPWLCQTRPDARVLVVDADPHQSLCGLLQCTPPTTLGGLRSQYERTLLTGRDAMLRPDETRVAFAERALGTQALYRTPHFDLLAIGQWELPGSQCTPNRVLGMALASLAGAYDYVIVDHEAGIEHIGRFTELPIDRLILVATPDALSLDVAGRVLQYAAQVNRTIHAAGVVLNRVEEDDEGNVQVAGTLDHLALRGAPVLGQLPESRGLRRCSRSGVGPQGLDSTDPWQEAVLSILPVVLDDVSAEAGLKAADVV